MGGKIKMIMSRIGEEGINWEPEDAGRNKERETENDENRTSRLGRLLECWKFEFYSESFIPRADSQSSFLCKESFLTLT